MHLGSVQGEHPEAVNFPKVADGGYLASDPQGGTARSDAFLVLQWPLMLKRETAGELGCPTKKIKGYPKDTPTKIAYTKKWRPW